MGPAFDEKFPYIHPRSAVRRSYSPVRRFVLALKPSMWKPSYCVDVAGNAARDGRGFVRLRQWLRSVRARYWIQVYPLLLVLVAMGVGERADQMTKLLILASILIVSFGTWHIRTMGFG